jgi:TRAP-type uncharacterized transport system substrate-binding protein
VIGRNLAKFIAPAAQIDLEVLTSAGSVENIHHLRNEDGVKFAIVQSDVYQAFISPASAGDANAAAIIKPLRMIMPLDNEEVYFIVRADSPQTFVHEIRDSRINVGPLKSGTAMSATTMYRLMFGNPASDDNRSFPARWSKSRARPTWPTTLPRRVRGQVSDTP